MSGLGLPLLQLPPPNPLYQPDLSPRSLLNREQVPLPSPPGVENEVSNPVEKVRKAVKRHAESTRERGKTPRKRIREVPLRLLSTDADPQILNKLFAPKHPQPDSPPPIGRLRQPFSLIPKHQFDAFKRPERCVNNALQRHLNDPYILLVAEAQAMILKEGFVPYDNHGKSMVVYKKPDGDEVMKHFIIPHVEETKVAAIIGPARNYVSGATLEKNLRQEEARYIRLQEAVQNKDGRLKNVMFIARTVFFRACYRQAFIPYDLPNIGGDIPDFIVKALTALVLECYEEGYLVDISPANFRCLQPQSGLTLVDFGLGLSNEDCQRHEAHDIEDYRLLILASFNGLLNDWESKYPGARQAIAAPLVAHKDIYAYLSGELSAVPDPLPVPAQFFLPLPDPSAWA